MYGDEEEDVDENVNWRQPADNVEAYQVSSGPFKEGEHHNNRPLSFQSRKEDPKSLTDNRLGTSKKISSSRHNKCIIHIDFDCFYCQVEVIRNPPLQDRPFGVYQKHVVVSSNYVARRLGVKKMSTKAEALKVCPDMIMVNGEDLSVYREFSMKMFNLMKTVSPVVERVGIDENFIDVTKLIDEKCPSKNEMIKGHCYGYEGQTDMNVAELLQKEGDTACDCGCVLRMAMPSSVAASLRKSLYDSLGLTSSAGISHSKVLAKLVGKMHKPNQQTTILPAFAVEFMTSRNVREIPGIGSRCSKLLSSMNVERVCDLGRLSRDKLKSRFGMKQGEFMADIALGIDNTEVNVSEDVLKSLSEEESYRKLTDFQLVKKEMTILIEKLITRLSKDGRSPRTIKLSLRKRGSHNFARICRQEHFEPTILKSEKGKRKEDTILQVLIRLFDKMIDREQDFDIAVINICFTSFDEMATGNSSLPSYFSKTNSYQINSFKTFKPEKNSTTENSQTFAVSNKAYKIEATKIGNETMKDHVASEYSFHTHSNTNISSSNESCLMHQKQLNIHNSLPESQAGKMESSVPIVLGKFSNSERVTKEKSPTCFNRSKGTGNDGLKADGFAISKDLLQSGPVNTSCEVKCPNGIDADVFRQLPKQIKDELLEDWKRKEHDVVTARSGAGPPKKKQKTIGNSGSNSIRKYFTKS